MNSRRFTIRIREAPEGCYSGQCLGLPGAISEGKKLEQLKANMTEAIQLVLESVDERSKEGNTITLEIN
jgi:predicted RNase H-like HicB family nuclease